MSWPGTSGLLCIMQLHGISILVFISIADQSCVTCHDSSSLWLLALANKLFNVLRVLHFIAFISSGFADTYKAYIHSTLEGLIKQVHSKLQIYCSEEVTTKPRFYHLSKRLALSEKVIKFLHCMYLSPGDVFPRFTGA